MKIGSRRATRITESKMRLPSNGISYMLTTGDEPLSNMETFYVKMTETESLTCQPEWKCFHSLRILRECSFINLDRNVGLDYVYPGAKDSGNYSPAYLSSVLYDAIEADNGRNTSWDGKWKVHSFQIRSGVLVFRVVPKEISSTSQIVEIECGLDHLAGNVLQFGIEVDYPCWQFWRPKRVVNVVCDATTLPERLKIAVTTFENDEWQEIRKIFYIAEFPKGAERTAQTRKFYNGRVEVTSRAPF